MDEKLRELVLAGKMPQAYKFAADYVMEHGRVIVAPAKKK